MLVLFTIAAAPLPLGSVAAPATAIWAIVLGIALLGLLTVRLKRGPLMVLVAGTCVAGACVVVLCIQLGTPAWFASTPDPVWAEASRLLGQQLPSSVAIMRNQSLYSFGLGITCFLAFATGLLMAVNRHAARRLLLVVAWSGAIYAGLAIVSHLIDPSRIFLLYEKDAHRTALTSPFVNRNTAAVYYGCCAMVWLLHICERVDQVLPSRPLRWQHLHRVLDQRTLKSLLQYGAGWLLCLLAMFLTGSRAGAGASLIGMIAAVVAFFHRRMAGRLGVWSLLLVSGTAALGLLQLLGGVVGGRFSAEGLSDEGRLSTYRATLRMIRDHPWLGSGFGSFEAGYPAYRTDDISLSGIWNRAHNSLLELTSTGGIPLAGLVVLAGCVGFAVLIYGARIRRRDTIIPIAAAAAGLTAIMHSMVDFSLQIPGYAIVIYALFGAGLCQSFRSGRPVQGRRPTDEAPATA